MKVVAALTAEDIFNANCPGDIFTQDAAFLKKEYQTLSKLWHPDVCSHPQASEIMAKINKLYGQAQKDLAKGTWAISNVYLVWTTNGRLIRYKYLVSRKMPEGLAYIGKNTVMYLFAKANRDIYENFLHSLTSLRYADKAMEQEFSRFLPKVLESFEAKEEDVLGVILSKPSDLFYLRDILNHYHGKVPPRHVAWIVSALLNLSCFIHYNQRVHNGITLDTVTISPPNHSAVIVGGWGFSKPLGDRLLGVPDEVYDIMPNKAKSSGTSTHLTDLESIKFIARTLLGNPAGTMLVRDPEIPKPFAEWVLHPAGDTPFKEYTHWQKVLDASWGKRQFVDMPIRFEDIYPPERK